MDNLHRHRFLTAILLYLTGTCLAQNAVSLPNCPMELRRVGEDLQIYNSTRTLSYTFKRQSKPWYITTAVTDVRLPNGKFVGGNSSERDSRLELSVFVSVPRGYGASPDGRDIRFCSHMMASVKLTSNNPADAESSCKGVISDKCVKEYENATLPVPALGQRCPDFSSLRSGLSAECRNQLFASDSLARNFSSTRCSLDKMPYLDLPANYTTFGTGGWIGLNGDDDREDFDRYDMRVQESIPVLMSVANGNYSSERKLLCIAPDQVVPGSRKPESKLGDQDDGNAASRVRGLGAVFLGVGIVMIFSLL